MEWFGPDYQEIFSDQPLDNYYCIKDVSGMVLEGYSNLERYSYFNVRFYPCHIQTKDGEPCFDYDTIAGFFSRNVIELKIQDNDLNPEDFKVPVIRRQLDMNSPVFKDMFQLIYSYLQIVNIETDEDITGLNFFTNHIRKQTYTRYDETFIIASPLFFGDIALTGGPVADVTLQLAAKVLTEKRQYTQLIDVLGDVGGLMEILYSFLNIISSFITEILYDRSLVNNLFTFDLNRKYVRFNKVKGKNRLIYQNKSMKDLRNLDGINYQPKIEDFERNENIEIYSREKLNEQNIEDKKKDSITVKKHSKQRKSQHNLPSKISLMQSKEKDIEKEDEGKKKYGIYNNENLSLGANNDIEDEANNGIKNIYINNWLICCFWCSSRKTNMNKILFEEGSKILTQKLDIMNMFYNLFLVEMMQNQLRIDANGMNMTNRCKKNLKIYYKNNDYNTNTS